MKRVLKHFKKNWFYIPQWRIEVVELNIFIFCTFISCQNFYKYLELSKQNKAANNKDYKTRFFKGLFIACIGKRKKKDKVLKYFLVRCVTLCIILLSGSDIDPQSLVFLLKEISFTLPSLFWTYCFSMIIDFFVSLYQKLLEKNINYVFQVYYLIFWIVCFLYALTILDSIMKKDYILFAKNSRIFISIIYFMTALGLIYFGLNLIYDVKKWESFNMKILFYV